MNDRLSEYTKELKIENEVAKRFGEVLSEVYTAGLECGMKYEEKTIGEISRAKFVGDTLGALMQWFLEDVEKETNA